MKFITRIAIVLALVTATVTWPEWARTAQAADFRPTLTNLDTGRTGTYKRGFPTKAECDKAIGNLNDVLKFFADPDPKAVVPAEPRGDEEVVDSVLGLIVSILNNTGKSPRFSIACVEPGEPA